MPTLLHGPGCNLGEWYGVSPSCALLGELQLVHGFRCYDIIARTRNVSECCELALFLADYSVYEIENLLELHKSPMTVPQIT